MITGNSNLLNIKIQTNPNLLTNWYFAGGGSQSGAGIFPINQKGQTSYTGNTYTIDCLKGGNTTTVVTLSSDGLIVTPSTADSSAYAEYYFDKQSIFLNKVVTISMLGTNNQLASKTVTFPSSFSNSTSYGTATLTNGNNMTLYVRSNGALVCRINYNASTSTTKVVAVKLEFGNIQTLAHQENGVWVLNEIPNFADQLWQCQRYFQVFKTQSLRPTYKEDFRPTMFKDPTLSTLTLDGTTYYTAEANNNV